MGPLAFTRGLRLSVDASSWILPISSVHSHWVSTRLRSSPRGRGGAGGTSPLAMRSLQSANMRSPRSRPKRDIHMLISAPRCPIRTRASQASTAES